MIHLLVLVAGAAALSWEVLWQVQASLALGVSSVGTAITLACTMGGMSGGAWAMGRVLRGRKVTRPIRLYGLVEAFVGVCGLVMIPAFQALMPMDAALYRASPELAPVAYLAGVAAVLGPPALAMGATLPVLGLVAARYGTALSGLYGANTLGASLGVLALAFFVIPDVGSLSLTSSFVATLDLSVAAAAWLLGGLPEPAATAGGAARPTAPVEGAVPWTSARVIVLVTGIATFALEVAWFRAMRAAFQATTDSFAIILASVLVPLAVAARVAPALRRRGVRIGTVLAAAGVAIVAATPLVERIDVIALAVQGPYALLALAWLSASLAILGPPVLLLGVAVPWLLDEQSEPARWGTLYAVNTAGAIVGALGAAWLLLPTFGSAATCRGVGAAVGLAGLAFARGRVRWVGATALALALGMALATSAGVGRLRVQGRLLTPVERVIESREGPDETVSVVDVPGGARALIVDGFQTADERKASHYMAWMGRLPMLAVPDARRALVICFGTGQTSNGVRQEGPGHLDIAELDANVLGMAPLFPTNQGVLDDPRVTATAMDGRAWLRRTDQRYDVITLEPMPPYFAGSNALYSREFYDLVAARLQPGGVAAQWLPFHLVTPFYAESIAATFRAVFPDALLWIDPRSTTGILLGRRGEPGAAPAPWDWPGLNRDAPGRTLSAPEVLAAVALDAAGLKRYAADGQVITDDNQLLSYGSAQRELYALAGVAARLNRVRVDVAAGRVIEVRSP